MSQIKKGEPKNDDKDKENSKKDFFYSLAHKRGSFGRRYFILWAVTEPSALYLYKPPLHKHRMHATKINKDEQANN